MADQKSQALLPEPPPTTANCPGATLGLSPSPPFPPAPPTNASMPRVEVEQVGSDNVRRTPECALRPVDPATVPCCSAEGTAPAERVTLEPPSAHPTIPAANPAEHSNVRAK